MSDPSEEDGPGREADPGSGGDRPAAGPPGPGLGTVEDNGHGPGARGSELERPGAADGDHPFGDPEHVEEELHPVLDALADLGVYAVVGALALALAGLVGIAAGIRPWGDAAVAVAIVVGSGSMVVGAVVGIASGQVSIRDREE